MLFFDVILWKLVENTSYDNKKKWTIRKLKEINNNLLLLFLQFLAPIWSKKRLRGVSMMVVFISFASLFLRSVFRPDLSFSQPIHSTLLYSLHLHQFLDFVPSTTTASRYYPAFFILSLDNKTCILLSLPVVFLRYASQTLPLRLLDIASTSSIL